MTEQDYRNGYRTAYTNMLHSCLLALQYTLGDADCGKYILEREEAITVLRRACATFGDNDWTEDMHLADILDKHLVAHLED